MPEYTAGSASVDITPNFRNFVRKLREDLNRVQAELDVEIGLDEQSLQRFRETLRSRLAGMDLSATVSVDADTAPAMRDVAALREAISAPASVNVDADTAAARAQIASLSGSSVSVNVRAAGGGRALGGLGGGSLGPAALAGALGISQLPAMATGVAAVGVELQRLTQSAALLPAIFTGAAAGISTLVVGMQNMGDAFDKNPEKAAEAMGKLADSARETVSAVRDYSDEWTRVQRTVQGNLFEGTAEPLRRAIDTQLPVIEQGMSGIASQFGAGLRIALGEFGSDRSAGALSTFFTNTADAAGKLNGAIVPATSAFRTLATTGSKFLPEMGQGLANLATKFDTFLTKADQSGDLARWMREGADAAKAFGSTVGNLGSSLSSVLRAAKGDGDGLLVTLDGLTERWATWLKSDEGQARLRQFFTEGREQLERWEPILESTGTVLKAVYEAAQTWSSIMLPFLQAGASLLADHESLVKSALVAWLAWRTVGPIVNGLQTAISGATTRVNDFRTASAAASTAGAGALRSSVAGLAGALGTGGVLGLAIGAATIGLGFLAQKHAEAKQAAEEQKAALDALGETLDAQTGKVTESTITQAVEMLDDRGFLERAQSFGVDIQDYTRASLGLDNQARDEINNRLTDVILEQLGSVEGKYLALPRRLGLSDRDIAQALQGMPDALQRYRDVVGTEAGISDLGSILAQMTDAGESAATLAGEMNNVNSETAKFGESARRQQEAVHGLWQLTEEGRRSFEGLGLAVQSVPDSKTVVVSSTTDEQQRKLEELGYTVTHMEDGTVKITLNDAAAKAQIAELTKPETKQITIEEIRTQLGPLSGLYVPAEPKATGGAITGGIPGRDSVPLLGMPGEHMLDTEDVQRLGGQSGVYRFRSALKAGLVRGYANGGAILPQAELPGRRTDEELARLQAEQRVDQANTERNKVYADPSSTPDQRLAADVDYQQAQNALEGLAKNKSTDNEDQLPAQYSVQGIMARAGGIIGEGLLSMFGLENSILSSNNVYNRAIDTTLKFYQDKEKKAQGEAPAEGGYGYQPKNLPTEQQDSTGTSGDKKPSSDAGGGVEQWRGTFSSVLRALGMPLSWLDLGLSQIRTESGGNPRAINMWDSNAANGTPSKGLMQVIDPTFAAYRSGMYPNDIWDPGANIAAALRYTVARYGGPEGVWGQGHGYDLGGMASGLGLMPKYTLKPERVLSPRQTEAFESMLPVMESINAGLNMRAPELPPGIAKAATNTTTTTTRDHSVNFNGPMHVMNNDALVREMDRWTRLQAAGAMAALP